MSDIYCPRAFDVFTPMKNWVSSPIYHFTTKYDKKLWYKIGIEFFWQNIEKYKNKSTISSIK